MNYKQLGAIALTLIICCPIALGFAMATEQTEVTGYETTDQVRISDLLLNASSPYYAESSSPANNSNVLQRIYYPSGGLTETKAYSPDFVKRGTTYTSLPILETVTQDFTLAGATGESFSFDGSSGASVLTVGNTGDLFGDSQKAYSYGDTWSGSEIGRILITYSTEYQPLHAEHHFISTAGTDTIRKTVLTSLMFYVVTDGGEIGYYLASAGGPETAQGVISQIVGKTYKGYGGMFDVAMAGSMQCRPYTDTATTPTSWTAVIEHPLAMYTDGSGNKIRWAGTADGDWTVMRSGSTWMLINGNSSETVTASDLRITSATAGMTSLQLTTTGNITGYADPAYGWKVPNASEVVTGTWWYNYQTNSSVTLMLDVSALDGGYFGLLPTSDLTSAEIASSPALLTISRTDGKVTITPSDGTARELGNYSHLRAVFRSDGWEVSGIAAWPAMGGSAQVLNTVRGSSDTGDFTHIRISGQSWASVAFRVDSATIRAGTFPSTEDYLFDVTDKFPNFERAAMELTSIGVYGDSITIGGTSYAVTDGRITVGDSAVPLKGALISAWPSEDGGYSYTINGTELPDYDGPLRVYFGGEWSLTSTLYNIQEVQETKTTFAPGKFAFDTQDFVVAAMLTAFGTFLVLCATGRASGTKAAFLAMICGGTIAVLMTML